MYCECQDSNFAVAHHSSRSRPSGAHAAAEVRQWRPRPSGGSGCSHGGCTPPGETGETGRSNRNTRCLLHRGRLRIRGFPCHVPRMTATVDRRAVMLRQMMMLRQMIRRVAVGYPCSFSSCCSAFCPPDFLSSRRLSSRPNAISTISANPVPIAASM